MLESLTIKHKVLLLAIVPALLLALILATVATTMLRTMAEEEIHNTREHLIAGKRSELKNYVDLAYSAISRRYEASAEGDAAARAEAVKILSELKYGSDGYLFGYDGDSVRVFSGTDTSKNGKSFRDYKDPNGKFLINELVSAGRAGGGYVDYMFPKPGQGDKPFPKLSYAIFLPKWNLMIGTGFYIDDVDATLAEVEARARSQIRDAILFMVGIAAVLALAIALAAMGLANSILKPLRHVVDSLRDISQGEGDLTRRLRLVRQDEIGALASGFDSFVEKIHQLVRRIADVTGRLASFAATVSDDADATYKSIDRQRRETDMVATAVNQMSATAHDVAQSTLRAADAAHQAESESENARSVVGAAVRTIHDLARDVEQGVTVLSALQTDVDAIGAVLDVIRGVAEQTNLLALNAAIEAARAGEQGRGFAVVADEVRALAGRTQQSTREIQAMIERLEASAGTAAGAMRKSSEASSASVEQVNRTGEALAEIGRLIATINAMSTQIATAAEQQTSVTEDINKNVVAIAQSAESAAQGAERTDATSKELASLGRELQELVGQFRV